MRRHPFRTPAIALLLTALVPYGSEVRGQEPARLGVRALAFSPDGKLLAACTGEPKEHGQVAVLPQSHGSFHGSASKPPVERRGFARSYAALLSLPVLLELETLFLTQSEAVLAVTRDNHE